MIFLIWQIVHPYLTSTLQEMEQSYMQSLVPYKDEVKDVSINGLKVDLSGVTFLESLVDDDDDDEDIDLLVSKSRMD